MAVGSVVRIPFGRQRLEGVVVGLAETSELPPRSSCAPGGVRADTVPGGSRRARAVDGGRVLLDAGARAVARAAAARAVTRTLLWAERGRARLDGQRLTDNQRALLERAAGAGRRATSARCGGWRRAGW